VLLYIDVDDFKLYTTSGGHYSCGFCFDIVIGHRLTAKCVILYFTFTAIVLA